LLAAITCSGVKVISNLQIKKDGQTALNPAKAEFMLQCSMICILKKSFTPARVLRRNGARLELAD
jgi:hypothetical protein